ncbi:MAG: hypothetical protein Q8K75_00545 [Chlamydiales bacterium]|nr:hypothetical protein [Chlamydiales bacterium]
MGLYDYSYKTTTNSDLYTFDSQTPGDKAGSSLYTLDASVMPADSPEAKTVSKLYDYAMTPTQEPKPTSGPRYTVDPTKLGEVPIAPRSALKLPAARFVVDPSKLTEVPIAPASALL